MGKTESLTVEATEARKKRRRPVGTIRLLLTSLLALTVAIFYGLLASGRIRAEEVISDSMAPTIAVGDRILVSTLMQSDYAPGDIVVFTPEEANELPLIKRIVGMPGDLIYVVNDRVFVNNRPNKTKILREKLYPVQQSYLLKVPADHYYVLGDNVENSMDSRFFGPIHRERLIGKAVLTYYPLSHRKWLESDPETVTLK
ncbi:MAG: signal peptidase I [Candidatus Sumerlaeia bacterium]|nr:signal peptidase I [Candidatus Sumerlaeia bacterium]